MLANTHDSARLAARAGATGAGLAGCDNEGTGPLGARADAATRPRAGGHSSDALGPAASAGGGGAAPPTGCTYIDAQTGNNVMRTIHGVGEMMTQMVLSRGSIFPLAAPEVPPSVHPSKQMGTVESEDITVMDTKRKIIEILQVKRPLR
ncbi:UNVERIFIED_CONTAM: hypothetical protein K2H54_006693 [Gekko kuhli]